MTASCDRNDLRRSQDVREPMPGWSVQLRSDRGTFLRLLKHLQRRIDGISQVAGGNRTASQACNSYVFYLNRSVRHRIEGACGQLNLNNSSHNAVGRGHIEIKVWGRVDVNELRKRRGAGGLWDSGRQTAESCSVKEKASTTDIIKYVANALGAAHFDPTGKTAHKYDLLRRIEAGELGQLCVSQINDRNLLYHEVLLIAQIVIRSPQIKELLDWSARNPIESAS